MKAETKAFSIPQTVFEITAEKETESETSLPDYLPNINRLIRAEEQPKIDSCEISSGKAVVKGRSVFCILYESDYKGKVCQAVFSTDFEQKFDLNSRNYGAVGDESGDVICDSDVSSAFVGCKLLSPRKLLLRSRDNIRFSTRRSHGYETPDKDRSAVPTYYRSENLSYLSYRQPLERDYELTESIVLNENEPSIGEIVFTNVFLAAPDIINEYGRLKINVDAIVKTLYENEQGTDYYTKNEIIPLSLTVDDNVLNESTVTFVKLIVPEISSEKENDDYGEPRVITVSFSVKALINILENKETDAVTDVFSPGYDHETEKSTVVYDELAEATETSVTMEKVFETAETDISSVLDASVILNVKECVFENGEVTVKGDADISVLGKGGAEGNRISAADFSVTFEETFKSNAPPDTKFTCSILPVSVTAKMTGKNKLSIRSDAKATLCGIRKCRKDIVSSSTLTEKDAKKSDGTIVICYPSQGDSLWDIAKKYSSSPEKIMSCNANAFTDGETVSKGTKIIMIPNESV